MEYVRCDLCDENHAILLFFGRDRLHGLPGSFNVVRCRLCGLVYVNPRPTQQEIKKYYPKQYGAYRGASAKSPDVREMRKRLLKVRRFKSGGRILDVGCGDGSFLLAAKKEGWEVAGVEINEAASDYARRLGLNVFTGELVDANLRSDHFDVITLWAVVEHLHNPVGTLKELRRILKDDGLLVITTQNFDSLEAKIFSARWFHLDVPRHLYQFDPITLGKILSRAGFQIVKMNTFPAGGVAGSLRYLMGGSKDRLPMDRRESFLDKMRNKALSLLFFMLSKCLALIFDLIRRLTRSDSEAIEVYAAKAEQDPRLNASMALRGVTP